MEYQKNTKTQRNNFSLPPPHRPLRLKLKVRGSEACLEQLPAPPHRGLNFSPRPSHLALELITWWLSRQGRQSLRKGRRAVLPFPALLDKLKEKATMVVGAFGLLLFHGLHNRILRSFNLQLQPTRRKVPRPKQLEQVPRALGAPERGGLGRHVKVFS